MVGLHEQPEEDGASHSKWVVPGVASSLAARNNYSLWAARPAIVPKEDRRLVVWVVSSLSGVFLGGHLMAGHLPSVAAATAFLVVLAIVGRLVAIWSAEAFPTNEDTKMLEAGGEGMVLVRIEFEVNGVVIGEDRGVIWAQRGDVIFNGQRTSFAIDSYEIDSSLAGGSRFIRWFSALQGADTYRLFSGYPSYRIKVSELSGRLLRVETTQKMGPVLAKARTQGRREGELSQFPPNTIDPQFRDSRLARTAFVSVVTSSLAIAMTVSLSTLTSHNSNWTGLLGVPLQFYTVWRFALVSTRELIGRLHGAAVRRRLKRAL